MTVILTALALVGFGAMLALPGNAAITLAFTLFGLMSCLGLGQWAWLAWGSSSPHRQARQAPSPDTQPIAYEYRPPGQP
jgi:hypothetical protein